MPSARLHVFHVTRTHVRLDAYACMSRMVFIGGDAMNPVYRIEQDGEEPIPYPTLADALREAPSHPEARIATSAEGVTLAMAGEAAWIVTLAGQDVIDVQGWRAAS